MYEAFITILIFLISYIISVTYTSIFYHRALCHNALTLSPYFKKFIIQTGFILTAIDPAIWICTHRIHHLYSDQEKDPHSPKYFPTLFKINKAHLDYYSMMNKELQNPRSHFYSYIRDLDLNIHPLMRLPIIPLVGISFGNILIYIFHISIYYLLYIYTDQVAYSIALAV